MSRSSQLAEQFDRRNLSFLADIPAIRELQPLEPEDARLIREARAAYDRERSAVLQRRRRAMEKVNEACRIELAAIDRWGSVAAIADKFDTTVDEVRHILGVRS